MKRKRIDAPGRVWLAATLCSALLACGTPQQATEEEPAEEVSAADVQEEMQEAAEALKAYSFEQKEEFEEWGEEQLAQIDTQLTQLRERTDELGEEARREWEDTLANLESERRALDTTLQTALDSTSDSWNELQIGFSKASETLGESIRRAADELETQAAAEAPPKDES